MVVISRFISQQSRCKSQLALLTIALGAVLKQLTNANSEPIVAMTGDVTLANFTDA